MSNVYVTADHRRTAADAAKQARRNAEERVRHFRKIAAAHAAAEADRQLQRQQAAQAAREKERQRAERRRVEVHALNKLLAMADAKQVELAFGPGAAGLVNGASQSFRV